MTRSGGDSAPAAAYRAGSKAVPAAKEFPRTRNLGVSRGELARRRCRLRNRPVLVNRLPGQRPIGAAIVDTIYATKGHPMKSRNMRVAAILSAAAALLL